MRYAPVSQPVIPEAVLAALRKMRLDLRLLALLAPLGLRPVGFEIRPNPRDEGDAPAVGEPPQAERAGGDRGQPARFAAVRSDQIHLRFLVVLALGRERDPLAVRRPARFAVLVARREPARSASIGGKQPQLGAALVFLHVV